MRSIRSSIFLCAGLLAATLAVTACEENKPEASNAPDGGAPQGAGAAGAKALTVKGSDTMVILSQQLAQKFMDTHPGTQVQVTGGGSGTGIAALINGTTDVADSSRPMKPEENQQVQAKRGKPVVETKVALDGLAIFVSKSNAVPALTLAQIKDIYLGKVKNWKEVGGPDRPLVLYGRENNSGTYGYFKEHVLENADFASDVQTLPGTAAVVNAVSKDPGAIGYGGIAYDAGIRAVPVKRDAQSPAIEPVMTSVVDGSYPISRYLFMYTAGEPEGLAKQFIDYARSPDGQKVVSGVGYYPLPGLAPPAPAAANQPTSPAPAGGPAPAPGVAR